MHSGHCATPILIWFCARSAVCASSCCARAALIWRGRSARQEGVLQANAESQSVSGQQRILAVQVVLAEQRYINLARFCSDASCTRTPAPRLADRQAPGSCAVGRRQLPRPGEDASSVPGDVPTTNSGVIGVTGPSLRSSSAGGALAAALAVVGSARYLALAPLALARDEPPTSLPCARVA